MKKKTYYSNQVFPLVGGGFEFGPDFEEEFGVTTSLSKLKKAYRADGYEFVGKESVYHHRLNKNVTTFVFKSVDKSFYGMTYEGAYLLD